MCNVDAFIHNRSVVGYFEFLVPKIILKIILKFTLLNLIELFLSTYLSIFLKLLNLSFFLQPVSFQVFKLLFESV